MDIRVCVVFSFSVFFVVVCAIYICAVFLGAPEHLCGDVTIESHLGQYDVVRIFVQYVTYLRSNAC